jgi:hypothetical protein
VALAVGQQELGFAIVFALENGYTFLDNKEGTPGRPSLPLAGGVVGASVVVRASPPPLQTTSCRFRSRASHLLPP